MDPSVYSFTVTSCGWDERKSDFFSRIFNQSFDATVNVLLTTTWRILLESKGPRSHFFPQVFVNKSSFYLVFCICSLHSVLLFLECQNQRAVKICENGCNKLECIFAKWTSAWKYVCVSFAEKLTIFYIFNSHEYILILCYSFKSRFMLLFVSPYNVKVYFKAELWC